MAALVGLLLLASGCGDERAVIVDLSVRGTGDRLCLAVVADGEVVFARAYEGEDGEGPPATGSLTLVAGDRVDRRVRVSAWLSHGGRIVARGSGESEFGQLDEVRLPIQVARCRDDGTPGGTARLRTVGTVELGATTSLAAIDLDADGRDELVTVDAGEALVALDAEAGAETMRVLEIPIPDGLRPGVAASLDGDCLPDLLAASGDGAVVVRSPGGAAETREPVGPPADAVAVGRLGDAGARLVIAGAGGLATLRWPDGAARMLDGAAFGSVAVADLTGDGFDDLVASGAAGARAWLGSGAGPTEIAGALPASFASVTGPVATGDLDGDGAPDLVGAAAETARVARNRGDGLLEDRSGPSPPASAAPIARLLLADLDGDCRDDLVLLDADGALSVLLSQPDLSFAPASPTVGPALEVAAADVDADGLHDLAILTRDGAIQVWSR